MVKNPPAMRETRVGCLGQEDPLEKGMATHSSVPAWRIPWTEEPGRPQSMGPQRAGHDSGTKRTPSESARPRPQKRVLLKEEQRWCPRKGGASSLF